MAILLSIIRLLVLFSNVWATFKALNTPCTRQSDGTISVRLVQARRRLLKNCTSVWIVWCVGTMSEPFVDKFIGILPFYSEAKALLWFVLLATRTMTADPLLLNLIHPTIKPYTHIIDSALDLSKLLADLVVAVVCLPFLKIISWWTTKPEEAATTPEVEVPPIPSTIRTRSSARRAEDLQRSTNAQSRSTSAESTSTAGQSYPPNRYIKVDPSMLNFDDDTKPVLRTRKRYMQSDPSLPLPQPQPSLTSQRCEKIAQRSRAPTPEVPTASASFRNRDRPIDPDSMRSSTEPPSMRSALEPPSTRNVPEPPQRSISQPLLPTNGDVNWDGMYPPLPSAYPATPLALRPLSLQPSRDRVTSLPILREVELDPSFAGAYPFTPPPARPLELSQSTDLPGLDFRLGPGLVDDDEVVEESSGRDVMMVDVDVPAPSVPKNVGGSKAASNSIDIPPPENEAAPKSALASYTTRSRVPRKRQQPNPPPSVEVIDLTLDDLSDTDEENNAPTSGEQSKRRKVIAKGREKEKQAREVLKPVETLKMDHAAPAPVIQSRTSTRRTRRKQ